MVTDFLQNWLQHLRAPWWGVALTYPVCVLLLNILLSLLFGGKARLRELFADLNFFYWLALVPGALPVAYIVNWEATRAVIAALEKNRIDVSAWRHPFLAHTGNWLQWLILALSLTLVLSSCRRYAIVRREKPWFAKPPWPVYLLRSMLTDLPVTYMVCMTVIKLIDSTIALSRVFAYIPSAITVDIWHPDGLCGLKPAYTLLLGQFGVELLVSFMPALMLRTEADQPYSRIYRFGVLIGIAVVITTAFIVLYTFDGAIERVRLSAIATAVDSLRTPQPRLTQLLRELHHTNLLIEYQIAASLPSSLPIPGWLKALGTSRILVLAVEFYSLLQPVLGIPKVPDILRRLLKAD
jgi:hypothetical protein